MPKLDLDTRIRLQLIVLQFFTISLISTAHHQKMTF
jgi:hypothetical protein